FLRDSVHRHLGTRLQTAARELLGPDAKVVYVIAPTVVTEQVSQQDVSSGEPAEPVAVAPAAPSTPLAPSGLADTAAPPTEPPQTFQSLVVGASNELAAHAAQQVAAGRHTGAPLVIWGPAGCGKTHLLKALRYAYRQRFPRARILSLTAEQFLGHYV